MFVTVRALLETAALAADIWARIEVILRQRDKPALLKLDDFLMNAGLGSRSEGWGDATEHQASNVLAVIDRVGKALGDPTLRSHYDGLSEHAHPNAAGTLILYQPGNYPREIGVGGVGYRGARPPEFRG